MTNDTATGETLCWDVNESQKASKTLLVRVSTFGFVRGKYDVQNNNKPSGNSHQKKMQGTQMISPVKKSLVKKFNILSLILPPPPPLIGLSIQSPPSTSKPQSSQLPPHFPTVYNSNNHPIVIHLRPCALTSEQVFGDFETAGGGGAKSWVVSMPTSFQLTRLQQDAVTGIWALCTFEYRVLESIGRGGTSVCFRVQEWDLTTNIHIRDVACKVVPNGWYRHSKSHTRKLQEEIRLHQKLQHPNIVQLVDAVEDAKHVYLLTELCSNGSLRDVVDACRKHNRRVQQHQPSSRSGTSTCLSENDTRNYMLQLLQVIAYLHDDQNIMHRDIKIGNILLASNNPRSIRVSDFGFAYDCLTPPPPPPATTSTASRYSWPKLQDPCGTPNYMDPSLVKLTMIRAEWKLTQQMPTFALMPLSQRQALDHQVQQRLHRASYGREVDIWASGVTWSVLRMGKSVFQQRQASETQRAILNRTIVTRPLLSPDGTELLYAMIRVKARTRPTAAQLLLHPYFVFSTDDPPMRSFTWGCCGVPAVRREKTRVQTHS